MAETTEQTLELTVSWDSTQLTVSARTCVYNFRVFLKWLFVLGHVNKIARSFWQCKDISY